MLFDLETIEVNQIIIWWLVLEKKPKWKRREIWIKVVVMLLQLYENLKVAEDKLTFNSLNLDRLEDHLRTVLWVTFP